MQLSQIQDCLVSADPQKRMRGITELRFFTPEIVVPLLQPLITDEEFVIRSFAVKGLGLKQTPEAFLTLLNHLDSEIDPNVRAEVANSLAKYGKVAIPHLLELFERDFNWLVRHSILASLDGKEFPEILLKICFLGLQGHDIEVCLASIAHLEQLKGTNHQLEALEIILSHVNSENVAIRAQVARVLCSFDDLKARSALLSLRNDSDYRVVGATLENLI